jgi:GT2 family glycosyltransferase
MVKVGVGIATYNGAERVDELLASLEKHTDPIEGGYEVAVLDDGGKISGFQRLVEVCESYGVELPLRHERNLGISATWNDLTRHFDSKYMILLNDDLILVDGWLEALVYFAEHNRFGTAGLPMYSPKITGKPHSGWKKIKHGWKPHLTFPKKKPLRVPAAPGPCFIFKHTLFDFVGGFDTRYLSFYEEVDFSLTLAKYGYPSYILPEPWIYHYWARTFAENPELAAAERMQISRAKFVEKWRAKLEGVYGQLTLTLDRQRLQWLFEGKERSGLENPVKAKVLLKEV